MLARNSGSCPWISSASRPIAARAHASLGGSETHETSGHARERRSAAARPAAASCWAMRIFESERSFVSVVICLGYWPLTRRQLPEPGARLLRLALGVSYGGDDVDDRRGDAVVAVGLDLLAAIGGAAEDEDVVDDLLGHEAPSLLAVARPPGGHPTASCVPTAPP